MDHQRTSARKRSQKCRRSCTVWEALRRREVLLLAAVYFLAVTGLYGFIVWFPTIVKRATGLPNLAVTSLSALPYLLGLVAMLWNGWHSDRSGERRWHTAVPLFLGGASLGLALLSGNHLPLAFLFMIVVGACTTIFMPSFWALPTELLTDSAAAASIGMINCVGNLGGFVGPFGIGYLQTLTHSFVPGLVLLLVGMVLSGAAVLALPRSHRLARG
jgi:MFS transporter, ACS family, tartrate transporter